MCWFCKKPKSPLQLMEEELLRQHSLVKDAFTRSDAQKMIDKINAVIINAAAVQLNKDLEKRLKSIEDAISDLYLLGKSEDNSGT
jgi:hypothetical protein